MSLIEDKPNRIIQIWFTAIILLFIMIILFGIERGLNEKSEAKRIHSERIESGKFEENKTKPNWDKELLEASNPIEVQVGIYVERIIELSLPDTSWVADFYIWFRWKDKQYLPGSSFQVIDGEIVKKEMINQDMASNPYYQLYRVKAKMTKFFNTSRFPRDDHLLTINIEDSKNQIYSQQYTPDTKDSAVSSRVRLHGYEVYASKLVQKYHSYKTHRGEVIYADTDKAQETFSQLIYGIWIKRPGWGNYIKMFEGLFAAVAVAMLTFFIRTTTTNRISLGVGAFFASVAATYVATRSLPNTGILTLTDVITGIAMLNVFLVIWHTIIATRLYELHQDEQMVHRFDMYGFIVFSIGFVLSNIALALSASI